MSNSSHLSSHSSVASSKEVKKFAGVIGYFEDPHALVTAMKKVREARFEKFDAFTPFPVHGLEHAQGLQRSFLPFVTFAGGLVGCSLGFTLQYWTSVVDWPLIVGGKPFNSWPAFVPVMFECTILFAGLSTAIGMFIINGLPNLTRKSFDPKLTRDRFALIIEAPVDVSKATDFLKAVGAKEVTGVYDEGWF